MKKLFLLGLMLLVLTGCSHKSTFDFMDFGLADKSNYIVSSDGKSVAWVEDKSVEAVNVSKVTSTIFVANAKGGDKKVVYTQNFTDKTKGLSLLGYFPETKIVVFGVKADQSLIKVPVYNQVVWKFIDSSEVKSLTDGFVRFVNTDKGIEGYKLGTSITYYQFSVDNYFIVDNAINYEKDKEKARQCLFSDIRFNTDNTKLVYLFECDNSTGNLDHKIITSDLEGGNRRELISSNGVLNLIDFTGTKVKYQEDGQAKETNI